MIATPMSIQIRFEFRLIVAVGAVVRLLRVTLAMRPQCAVAREHFAAHIALKRLITTLRFQLCVSRSDQRQPGQIIVGDNLHRIFVVG